MSDAGAGEDVSYLDCEFFLCGDGDGDLAGFGNVGS